MALQQLMSALSGDYIFDGGTKTCLLPYAEPYPPKLTPKCANPVTAGSGCKLESCSESPVVRTGSSPINLELALCGPLTVDVGGRLVGHESWFFEPLDRRLLLPVAPDCRRREDLGRSSRRRFRRVRTWTPPATAPRPTSSRGSRRPATDGASPTSPHVPLRPTTALGRLQQFERFDGSFVRISYESASSYWPRDGRVQHRRSVPNSSAAVRASCA